MQGLGRKLIAEFIGTFALILIGAGSIAVGAGLTGIALAHGLTIAIMALALGPISGGHFNPAVSFALFLMRKINTNDLLAYWGAQLTGALVASLLLTLAAGSKMIAVKHGIPALDPSVNVFGGLLLEFITTFFLMLTITTVAVRQNHMMAGLFIGLTITIDILLAGPLTGAAMNPARWFGPAIVSMNFSNFWIYWIGPMAGAAAGGLLGMWLYDRKEQDEASS
jgi:MIP family channel proteins